MIVEKYEGLLGTTLGPKEAQMAYRYALKIKKKWKTLNTRQFVSHYIHYLKKFGERPLIKILRDPNSFEDLWWVNKSIIRSKEYLRASCSYADQKRRRNVYYSRYEFIQWWLNEIKGKNFKCSTVGRKDHSKDYSFDNIEIQEKSENSVERVIRAKGCVARTKVFIINPITKKPVAYAISMKEMASAMGFNYKKMQYALKKKKPLEGFLLIKEQDFDETSITEFISAAC